MAQDAAVEHERSDFRVHKVQSKKPLGLAFATGRGSLIGRLGGGEELLEKDNDCHQELLGVGGGHCSSQCFPCSSQVGGKPLAPEERLSSGCTNRGK